MTIVERFHSNLSLGFSLKNETSTALQNLDVQIQEEDKLRQHARSFLSIIQHTKVQLIELHPTVNHEADDKLQVRLNKPQSLFLHSLSLGHFQ